MVVEKKTRYDIFLSNGSLPEDKESSECFFFLNSSRKPIPVLSSLEEAEDTLPTLLEYGLINSPPIMNLEDSLIQVEINKSFFHNESVYI